MILFTHQKKKGHRIGRLAALLLILLMLTGCATKIQEVESNPDKYKGKEVTVSGKVTSVLSVSFLGINVYKVDDGTGSIWVQSAGGVPAENESVRVTGKIETGVTIGGQNYGLLLKASK